MSFVTVGGMEVYYEQHGQGESLILIEGYTCDHAFWVPILHDLAKSYQVLLFDNRASGRTTDAGQPFTIDDLAQDVLGLMDVLKIERAHIVGQSMGGTIAQTLAAKYPDRVNKLVLLTTSAHWRKTMQVACEYLLGLRHKPIDFREIFDAMLPWIFGDVFLSNQKSIDILWEAYQENKHPQSIADQRRQLDACLQFDGRGRLKNIRAETLVMSGRQDLFSLPADSAYLIEHIANACGVELDCAHGIVSEVPRDVVREVVGFLG